MLRNQDSKSKHAMSTVSSIKFYDVFLKLRLSIIARQSVFFIKFICVTPNIRQRLNYLLRVCNNPNDFLL